PRAAWPPRGRPRRSTSSGVAVGRRVESCVTVLQMMSISNAERPQSVEERILDGAAGCVIAYGVDRVTLTEIARRAGVSRPTVYRRFPDTRSILAALLTMRITHALDDVPSRGVGREPLVERIVAV